MVQITHKRLLGGTRHEHISQVRWYNPNDGESSVSTQEQMVAYLRTSGSRVYICDGKTILLVGTITVGETCVMQTHKDGFLTDDLLELPDF